MTARVGRPLCGSRRRGRNPLPCREAAAIPWQARAGIPRLRRL